MSITAITQVPDTAIVEACRYLAGDVERLSHAVARLIVKKEHYYADSLGVDGLLDSVRPNLLSILEALSGQSCGTTDAPRRTGRLRAEQGVPLPVVERAYRLGMSHVWDELVRLLGRDPDRAQELLGSASAIWRTLDQYLEVLAAAYREVEAEHLQRDARLRDVALAALFHGTYASGLSALGIAATLRLPTRATFVVIATDPLPASKDRAIVAAERSLAADGVRSVWRTDAEGQIGLAALPRHYPVDRLASLLPSLKLGRSGLSEAFGSITEASAAVADARSARTAATPGTNQVLRYEDARVAVLLVSAPDNAADLQRDVLGGLLGLPGEEQDRLLGTLRAWYDAKGSTAEAGRRLHCHANTVRYRLGKLSDATGRNLSEPVDVAHLYLAMEARRVLSHSPVAGHKPTANR
jgi:hypothetical protein